MTGYHKTLNNTSNNRYAEILTKISRVPWFNIYVKSLRTFLERDSLTDKQKGFIMSLYTDACVISDEEIAKQVSARVVLIKSIICLVNTMKYTRNRGNSTLTFLDNIRHNTNKRRISDRQIEAIYRIAHNLDLRGIDYNDDGWSIDVR